MDVITEAQLLERINAFLLRHEMAKTTFGRLAASEASFIASIEKGRSPSLKVVQRVIDFMRDKDREVAEKNAPRIVAGEEGPELPFSDAPVNHTGASSAISSSTTDRPTTPEASASCRDCSTGLVTHGDPPASHSCSAEEQPDQTPAAVSRVPAAGAGAVGPYLDRSGSTDASGG